MLTSGASCEASGDRRITSQAECHAAQATLLELGQHLRLQRTTSQTAKPAGCYLTGAQGDLWYNEIEESPTPCKDLPDASCVCRTGKHCDIDEVVRQGLNRSNTLESREWIPVVVSDPDRSQSLTAAEYAVTNRSEWAQYRWVANKKDAKFVYDLGCTKSVSKLKLRNSCNDLYQNT